jgi:hypothetical protein
MFLQDSFYYQDYSYEIVTELNFPKYEETVVNILHPSGMKLFGRVVNFSLLETIIEAVQEDSGTFIATNIFMGLAYYTLGGNYSWIDKISGASSVRVYNGNEWDNVYVNGEAGYNLEDDSLERTYTLWNSPLIVDKKGWMSKFNMVDFDITQPQDYVESKAYEGLYLESSYILTPLIDEQSFIDTYIDVYVADSYVDADYV